MKKTYIIPEMEIVKVETQQLVAASLGYGDPTSVVESREEEFPIWLLGE